MSFSATQTASRKETPTGDTAAGGAFQVHDSETNQPEAVADHERDPCGDTREATIPVEASIAPLVSAFILELAKPERAPFVLIFLRRLNGTGSTETKRKGGMPPSQHKIVELCSRPEGATAKELAEGCGWPSIAAARRARNWLIDLVTICTRVRERTGAGSAFA
jgi:hypothetical protein